MRALPRTGRPLTNGKGDRDRIKRLTLSELSELLETREGKRPRADRLDRDDRALSWCVRKANSEGPTFRTTYTQAAAGLGYPVTGDRESDFRRFGKGVWRALTSLERAGLIRWGGIKRRNGQWRCLEVELLDACAQAPPPASCEPGRRRPIRRPLAAHERGSGRHAPRHRRVFFTSLQTPYPYGVPPLYRSGEPRGKVARARAGPSRPFESSPNGRNGSMEGTTAAAADRARLIDGFEGAYGVPARFSHRRWGARLDRALQRLDRYADQGRGRRGAGAELALSLIASDAAGAGDPLGLATVPRSLAWWVPVLDQISKDWRRAQRPKIRAARRRKKQERATGARSATRPGLSPGRR